MRLIACLALVVAVAGHFRIDSNQFIVDNDGLKRIYHGVNVIYKIPPFYPPIQDHFDPNDSLADEDLENLRKWGMNLIRLYVGWEAAEPVKGQYNITYLSEIKKIVERCERFGITVLLDAHQDVLSRFFCGEGFPDWAISRTAFKFPFPLMKKFDVDENGYPLISECLEKKFAIYYMTFDASKTFQDLFENTGGIADNFAEFWGWVADYFKDVPNVIGYEIINEPVAGTIYHNIFEFLQPGVGNNKNLLPLYQKVSKAIRKNDKNKLLFFEPGTTDYLGGSFSDSPGGLEYRDKEVYSYHIYCPFVDNHSVPTKPQACKFMDSFVFGQKERAAQQLRVGKFLTEFGAIDNSDAAMVELNYLLSLMESKFTSWAYWEFKYYADITTQAHPGNIESFYNDDGTLFEKKVKTLARPYALSICGKPIDQKFTPSEINPIFNLSWEASNNCNGKNTLIFLSQEYYYQNFTSFFIGCNECKLKQIRKSYYEIELPQKFNEGQFITLTIN